MLLLVSYADKCPKPYTVLYPMSSRNKFQSVLTLAENNNEATEPSQASISQLQSHAAGTGAVDSVFEHHEYPGLWRYAEIKLGSFSEEALSNDVALNFPDDDAAVYRPIDLDELPFNFSRWVVKYPFNSTESSFASSSPMLNNVWKLCRDTLLHTSLDTFTDSNTRERLPYEADGFITARSR